MVPAIARAGLGWLSALTPIARAGFTCDELAGFDSGCDGSERRVDVQYMYLAACCALSAGQLPYRAGFHEFAPISTKLIACIGTFCEFHASQVFWIVINGIWRRRRRAARIL